jgi:hypothetical protein
MWNEADLAPLYRALAGLWEQLADVHDPLTRENLIVAIGATGSDDQQHQGHLGLRRPEPHNRVLTVTPCAPRLRRRTGLVVGELFQILAQFRAGSNGLGSSPKRLARRLPSS